MRYAAFLTATFVSFAGDWLTTLALSVALYQQTGSAAAPAGFVAVRSLPRLAGALGGGVIADHVRVNLAISTVLLIQAAIAAALVVAVTQGAVLPIYVAVAASQLIGSTVRPMQQAMLPSLVSTAFLGRASALFGTGNAVVVALAPAIGVGLIRLSGPGLLVAIDAASFVVAALVFLGLSGSEVAITPAQWFSPGLALAGLQPCLADPVLRSLSATYLLSALVVGTAQSSLVVIAAERLGSADISGLLYAALGGGALVAGVAATSRLPRALGRDLVFLAGAVSILPLAALALVHAPWQAAAFLALSELGAAPIDAWTPAEIARRVERPLLGRANAVVVFATFLGVSLGSLLAIVLLPAVGWPATLVGVSAVAITALFTVTVTATRHTAPAHAG